MLGVEFGFSTWEPSPTFHCPTVIRRFPYRDKVGGGGGSDNQQNRTLFLIVGHVWWLDVLQEGGYSSSVFMFHDSRTIGEHDDADIVLTRDHGLK